MSIIKTLQLFIITTAFAGCASRYMPHASFAPLLSKKGELSTSAGVSTNSIHGGIAFAPVNHVALRVTGSATYKERIGYSSPYFFPIPGQRKYLESGIGFFINKNNMLYELYGGVGFGKTEFYSIKIHSGTKYIGTWTGHFFGNYMMPYAQFNVGRKGEIIDFGGSVLLSRANYHIEGQGDYGNIDQDINIMAFEPHAFFRLGNENIKLEIKAGFMLTDRYLSHESEPWQTTVFHFSTGLIMNLNLYNKKNINKL